MKVRGRPWGLVVVVLVVAGLCAWLALRHGAHEMSADSPSVPVSAATVRRADVPVVIEAIGAAQAWQSDTIHAQITGRLLRVAVAEGTEVKIGELIAQIDPAPFRAALLQARGALERDQAQLDLARLVLKRDQSLLLQDSIAAQQVDEQQAMVKELEGTVLTDQGAVDSARVNLAYCTITSPVSGWVGVRLIDPGNLVSPTDSTGIITINQIEPVAVAFSVPQGDFQRLRQASNMFSRPLETQAYSQDTDALLGSGILRIVDNHVDPGTGSVALKARFANTGRLLWPGQFVNVRLTLNVLHAVVTIPNAAVNQGPGQPYAYVIGADHHVSVRPIKVTLVQDATAVIGSGLQPGEAVVTDGQMDLKPGSAVSDRAQPATSGAVEPAATQ